jgi:predicted nucleic acid-binding protein
VNSGKFDDLFERNRKIALDTGPFVFWLAGNSRYFEIANYILGLIEKRNVRAVTSTITLTELLVEPYRAQDRRRVDRIYAVLVTYPHLEWIAPTVEIADRAARFRAEHDLKTPNAIQAATAMLSGATAFIANDPTFRRIPGLGVLILDEMLQ